MPDFTDDVFFATIGELNAKLTSREFSAVELTRAFSERLEKLGPRYNALALSLREQALKRARDTDGDIKRGRLRGRLQGIPYGAKDLLSVEGRVTSWGARPFASQVFPYDAAAIQKLARVGAAVIGKLAMVELAGGGGYRYAAASLFGPGLNPWDRSRWSGGSSSGSGSAVAAGLVPFALGSETWGSIMTPCAYCGITGLRPTYGLVSRYGAMPLAWTMDKIGPMGRSVEDCALVLSAIAGGDSKDPGSAGKSFYYWPKFERDMKTVRVGYAPVDFAEWAEPAARPAFQAALETVRSLGVDVREAALPDFPYEPLAGLVIDAEGSSVFQDLIESGRVNELADQNQIAGLKAGLDIPARDYLKAMRARRLMQHAFNKLFVEYEILLSFSCPGPATPVSEPLDKEPDRPKPSRKGLSELSAAGNLLGLPALFLPCGFAGGLPVGIQLVGRPLSEGLLVALGSEFQKRTDWHRRRPPAS
ncbi:MAG TPA: amidase [Bryobacteraceae bacterium]|nr:amidase [Bryobacteraceae bacterium]